MTLRKEAASLAVPVVAAMLLAPPLLYVASYAALATPGDVYFLGCTEISPGGPVFGLEAQYRVGGDVAKRVYAPLHRFDRKLRPGMWHSELKVVW